MKLLSCAAAALLLSGLAACSKTPPRIAELADPVGRYLTAYKKSSCHGEVTLDKLEVRRVGAWSSEGEGGFPVFADFAVTCHEPALSSTFDADDGATTTAATCMAKKVGKAWECSLPVFAVAAEKEMQRQVEEMTKKLPK